MTVLLVLFSYLFQPNEILHLRFMDLHLSQKFIYKLKLQYYENVS